jgi:hypothetical protein
VAPVVMPTRKPARPQRAAPPPPAASAPQAADDAASAAQAVADAASVPQTGATTDDTKLAQADAAAQPAEPAASTADAEGPVASAVASAASAAASSAPVAFEWPPSTRLSYTLAGNYKGEVKGNAQVEWVRQGTRYQVHMDVWIGAQAAPLVGRRMTSDGELTDRGLEPKRYDEETRALFRELRRRTIVFDGEQVWLHNGKIGERMPGIQDAASQFVQMTWMFTTQPQLLRVGNRIEVPLALPTRVDRWIYDVVEAVTLDTPVGTLDTLHLRPRAEMRANRDLVADVWFAPTLQYLPVRLLIRQDEWTYIDLMLERLPQQAAPAPEDGSGQR